MYCRSLVSIILGVSLGSSFAQTLVQDFQVQVKGNGNIQCIAEDKSGNFILAGDFDWFETFSGTVKSNVSSIVKVNELGEPIKSFFAGSLDGQIKKLKVLKDDAVLILGNFSTINNQPRNKIALIAPNGLVDFSFNFIHSYDDIKDFDVQSNGKILLTVEENANIKLIRLNQNGSVDNTFRYQSRNNFYPLKVLVDRVDRVVVNGHYFENGNTFENVRRFSKDGLDDNSFTGGFLYNNFGALLVQDIKLTSKNEIIIAGAFDKYNSIEAHNLVKLDSTGNPSTEFSKNFGAGLDMHINSVSFLADERFAVCGQFTNYFGFPANVIVFNGDGSFNKIVALTSSNNNNILYTDKRSRLLLGGTFSFIYGPGFSYVGARHQLAMFNTDFSLNDSFQPLVYSISKARAITVQPNGKVTVGGNWWEMINPRTYLSEAIQRINTDGSVDKEFVPNTTFVTGAVLKAKSNDEVLAGGDFSSINGKSYKGITLLNNQGAVSDSFAASKSLDFENDNPFVLAIEMTDSSIFLGGQISGVAGHSSPGVVKLNHNGSTRLDFKAQLPSNSSVYNLKILDNGKILTCGYFPINPNGFNPSFLVRLNPDGSVDQSFQQYKGIVEDFAIDLDGGIVVGSHNKVVKLKPDGSVDANFKTVTFTGNYVVINQVAMLEDGKCIITGDFTRVNGTPINAIAVLDKSGQLVNEINFGLTKKSKINDIYFVDKKLYLLGGIFTNNFQSSIAIIDFSTPPISNSSITLKGDISVSGFNLNWQITPAEGVDGYVIERSLSTQNPNFTLLDSVRTPAQLNFTDKTINPIFEYIYRVKAYNRKFKTSSPFSNFLKLGPLPLARTSIALIASISGEGIKLNWQTSAAEGVDGYIIQRSLPEQNVGFALLDSVRNPAQLSFADKTNNPAYEYVYRMQAYNWKARTSSSFSNTVKIGPLPLTRTSITLTSEASSEGTKLNWSVSSFNDIEGYVIERTSLNDNLVFQTLDSVKSPNASNFIDSKMEMNRDFFYRLKAYSRKYKSQSPYSNIVKGELIAEAAQNSELQIFPNPAKEVAIIALPEKELVISVNIFGEMGDEIHPTTLPLALSSVSVDLQGIAPGVYFLVVQTEKRSFKSRIVKL